LISPAIEARSVSVKKRKHLGETQQVLYAKYEKTMQKSRAHVAEDETCSPL